MQQKTQKNTPIRRCVGCGQGMPKQQLVRVVRSAQGIVSLDESGKKPGRGAYVCKSIACLEKAQKRKALQRAFGLPVPKELMQQLSEELEASEGQSEGENDS